MDNSKRIGIIGYGNDQWVAGVLYIQSLIIGRFLLNETAKNTSLFLHKDFHNAKDFLGFSDQIEKISQFDYFYGSAVPVIKRIYIAWKRFYQDKRPIFPDNNLPRMLAEQQTEVIFPANALLSSKYSKTKLICWIPDFQELHLPEYSSWVDRARKQLAFKRMTKVADRIVLSNEFSYQDACRLAPNYHHKFAILPFTMHLGKDWRLPDPLETCKKYDVPDDYLMFPSQFWKHKNHATLFKALFILKLKGMKANMVCTGVFNDPRFPDHCKELRTFIDDNGLQNQIQILGLLPREDQVQLMRQARAIVQPSLFEGWSALLEDCRSLGKTVFVSDIKMHRDQKPDDAIFFDPKSPEQLASLIEEHWSVLPSGIDVGREEIGERLNINNLKNFASKFSEICNSID